MAHTEHPLKSFVDLLVGLHAPATRAFLDLGATTLGSKSGADQRPSAQESAAVLNEESGKLYYHVKEQCPQEAQAFVACMSSHTKGVGVCETRRQVLMNCILEKVAVLPDYRETINDANPKKLRTTAELWSQLHLSMIHDASKRAIQ